jgi:hypothetical protein
LIGEDRADDARRVWREALAASKSSVAEPSNHSLIWDGNFAVDFANGGLGWRWGGPAGVSINFDAAPANGGERSVRLDFSGGMNLYLESPSQFVPVDPGQTYHFHALLRAERLTTESGVCFSIIDPNHPNTVLFFTDNFTGSRPWTAIDGDVAATANTHFLLVRLFRTASLLFDNKLSGTAWIADISLVPLDGAPGHTSP